MKRVCLIGQFPPPIHGLSKALDVIIKSDYLREKFLIEYIDIKNNRQFFNHVVRIKKSQADLYYFTISQTIFGNIRDMLILRELLNKNKKVIIHYHGGYYKNLYKKMNPVQRFVNKRLISKIDCMIALSESLKKLFVDVIDVKKIKVCENFIEESSLIDNNEFNKKVDEISNKERIEILYLSNFIKSKGYLDVLEAAKSLKNEKVIFHFAGQFFNQQDEKEFKDYIDRFKLENIVKYHGVVSGNDKKQLLRQSDIFVLPTYYPKEGQPISIIEAMGNGLAVITTNHAGIPDIVSEENGVIVNPKAPKEIREAVQYLIKHRDVLKRIAETNRSYTLRKFKEIHYIKRLEKIFNEVLRYES
jgi:glycosyltransferase involved in cell wall biosynthesis